MWVVIGYEERSLFPETGLWWMISLCLGEYLAMKWPLVP